MTFDAPLRMPGRTIPMVSTVPIDGLDAGIVKTVAYLRAHGFDTTDSGDGQSKLRTTLGAITPEMRATRTLPDVEVDCTPMAIPHVFMVVAIPAMLVEEADRLAQLLRAAFVGRMPPRDMHIEASYDPSNRVAVLALLGLDDASLP